MTKKTTTKSTTPKSKAAKKSRAVLITTLHRGVFFGYSDNTGGDTVKLTRGRNVVYWSAETKGFMGLAANGPNANCKIGPAADIELRNVTSVSEVSDSAALAFEAGPWG
jgi:hypothetical protein